MKISYIAKEKSFVINAKDNEKDKLKFVFNHIDGYTIDFVSDDSIIIHLDTNKAITPQKEDVKAMYATAKEVWKYINIPADNTNKGKENQEMKGVLPAVKNTDKKTVYIPKNTKKKKQRRIIQINKALNLLGEKCTLYTAIHCLSYVQETKHRNGYFINECVAQ